MSNSGIRRPRPITAPYDIHKGTKQPTNRTAMYITLVLSIVIDVGVRAYVEPGNSLEGPTFTLCLG